MKTLKLFIVCIIFALSTGSLIAADLTVPNNFSANTTAVASEVNANFDAVETAVNDNNKRISDSETNIQINAENIQNNTTSISNIRSINVYVDNIRRGALIQAHGGSNVFINANSFVIMLDSRYFALLTTAGDGLRQLSLAYKSADCTGQPYLNMSNLNSLVSRQGFVFSNDTPELGTLYYIQAGMPIETITVQSIMFDGLCSVSSSIDVDLFKVFVNDSIVTGVAQSDFIGNVTIGF